MKRFRISGLSQQEAEDFLVSFLAGVDGRVDEFERALRAVGGPAVAIRGEGAEGLTQLWEWYLATYVEGDGLPIEEAGHEYDRPPWVWLNDTGHERAAVAAGLGAVVEQRILARFGPEVYKVSVNKDPSVGDSLQSADRRLNIACSRLWEFKTSGVLKEPFVHIYEPDFLVRLLETLSEWAERSEPGPIKLPDEEWPFVTGSADVGGSELVKRGQVEISFDEGITSERRARFDDLLKATPELTWFDPDVEDRGYLIASFNCDVAGVRAIVARLWPKSA